MSNISRFKKDQKHYTYERMYPDPAGRPPSFDIIQYRETPSGWMKRVIAAFPWYKNVGPWSRVRTNDLLGTATVCLGKTKKKLQAAGVVYKP